jgi:hypothetical protein
MRRLQNEAKTVRSGDLTQQTPSLTAQLEKNVAGRNKSNTKVAVLAKGLEVLCEVCCF